MRAGVHLQAVQQLLGHSRIDETMRYAHLSPDMKREAVSRLDSLGAKSEIFGQYMGNGQNPANRRRSVGGADRAVWADRIAPKVALDPGKRRI